jgi:hypothetical protein
MVVLLATDITCTQSINLLQRITNVVGLTESQKTEIIVEIRKTIPFCPVTIRKDAK